MPPLAFVPNVVKLTIAGDAGTFPWANVLHWGYSGTPPTGAACTAFASALLTAWGTNFAPHMWNGSHIKEATCTDLSSGTAAAGVDAATSDGTGGAGEVPASASVLVVKEIARRYKGGHPRSYVYAGVASDLDSSSAWSSALVAAISGAYAAVSTALDGLVSGATTLNTEVAVSYIDKAVNPVAPFRRPVPAVFNITGSHAVAQVASQRRRMGR
jgi:hypothetical protein